MKPSNKSHLRISINKVPTDAKRPKKLKNTFEMNQDHQNTFYDFIQS